MQAITVRYIGPTNHKSARLVAECERGRIVIGYPCGSGDPFVVALLALLQKFAREDEFRTMSDRKHNPWLRPWFKGETKGGQVVFCPCEQAVDPLSENLANRPSAVLFFADHEEKALFVDSVDHAVSAHRAGSQINGANLGLLRDRAARVIRCV